MARHLNPQTTSMVLGVFALVLVAGASYYLWNQSTQFTPSQAESVLISSNVISKELNQTGIFSKMSTLSLPAYDTGSTNLPGTSQQTIQYKSDDLGKTNLSSYE